MVLTARVHPGESNSSFMMKGVIDFLTSDSREAKLLRKKFVFRIVPMLNPDGVIYGNYRCSLLGVDLNRRWKSPNIHLHPTIYYTKKLIQMFSEDNEIALYCDMHGHSMKKNVFVYACSYKNQHFDIEGKKTNIFIRLIPFLLSKRNKLFSYESSHFRMERFKESTARIVNFKEFNILASYTLEASFLGSDTTDPDSDPHMDQVQLESIGRDLCKQLTIFISPKEFRLKLQELSLFLNSPFTFGRKRAVSARRKDLSREENSSPVNENEDFNIKEAIKEIPEDNFEVLCKDEEKTDSGGSDAEASDNDDKKISYLLKKDKKRKKKKHEKNKSLHICQNIRQSSNMRIRNPSLTPEVVTKKRSRSKISVIKNSYNNIILKPPVKKQVQQKSPDIEDSIEMITNFNSLDIKGTIERHKKNRESMPLRTSRGIGGFIISSAASEGGELQAIKPLQRYYERNFKALNLKKIT